MTERFRIPENTTTAKVQDVVLWGEVVAFLSPVASAVRRFQEA